MFVLCNSVYFYHVLFDNIYYLKFICLFLYVAKVSFSVNTLKNFLTNEMGVSHTQQSVWKCD